MELAVTPSQFDTILDLTEYSHSDVAVSHGGVRAFWVNISPALAEKILQTYAEDYRKLRPRHSEKLAKSMRTGNWDVDGSPVRLCLNEDDEENGQHLADGQHRLTAIVLSGTTQEFLVIDRLPVTAYDSIDTDALTRTYIDILRRRGYTHCSSRAALTKLIYYWDYKNTLDSRQSIGIPEMDAIHENPEYKDQITWAIHNGNNLDRRIYVKKSILHLALFILGSISQTSTKELFSAVAIGEGLYRGQPAYALMNRLRNDHNNEREKVRTNDNTMYLIFRTWIVYHQNTMRPDNNQLVLEGNLPIPARGVTVRDLKQMLQTEPE